MVKSLQDDTQEVFVCEECGVKYGEKEWAEKCAVWCKQHNSCNIEIIAHSITD